ncbi:hypothetical protein [Microbacterium sp. SS28]|uniref:COG1470 family protein n=1 Tax=Microbacterium sp. SS28 TaxID=2919948 RepID=UPI001FA98A4F|nr:hypothetical protein [Microbacterium sp. SS28]
MAVAVSIEPAAVAATPGTPVEVTVTVRNDSQIVEEYRLLASGPGGGCVTLEPDHVSVYPGRSETVVARILVARSPGILAGELDVAIQVMPTAVIPEDVEPEITRTTVGEVAELIITVEAFAAVAAEIVPKVSRSRGRKRVRLAIDNNGNAPIAASLIGAGSERLTVNPREPEVVIDPGHAQFVRVTLAPRRRVWRGQAASHPYSVVVTPSAGEPIVADGIHMQEPVFPSWFWKALLALAALIALLILLWNLLVKPTVEEAAREAVAEPLAEVQGQAEAAEQAAAESADSAKAAQEAAEAAATGTPAPVPPPPAPTVANQTNVITLTAGAGAAPVRRGLPDPVPDGSTLRITDLVVQNPQGDVATLTLGYGTTVLLTLSTENYRDLDLHFVTPIEVPAGQTLQAQLSCLIVGDPPGRTPERCLSSILVTSQLVTPPPAG